jgi:hypothetical protein
MEYASGHLKSVSFLTHRPLPSAAPAAQVTPVRGREGIDNLNAWCEFT